MKRVFVPSVLFVVYQINDPFIFSKERKENMKKEDFEWDDDPKVFIFNEYIAGRTKMHTKRLDLKNWVMIDETYIDQMKVRQDVLNEHRDESFVTNILPRTNECKWELYEILIDYLPKRFPDKFELHSDFIRNKVLDCNVSILKDGLDDPLIRISHLTQEDWIIMEWDDTYEKYVLTAGLLCFPSSWWLQEKFNKHLTQIHGPVKPYLDHLDKLVQSLLRKMKPESPVWRANWGIYNNLKDLLDLYAPPSENKHVSLYNGDTGHELIMREEYQTLRKLPKTDCVVFSLRYYQRYIADFEHLPLSDCQGLLKAYEGLTDDMKEYKGAKEWGDALSAYLHYIIDKRQSSLAVRVKSYMSSYWLLSAMMGLTFGGFFFLKHALQKTN